MSMILYWAALIFAIAAAGGVLLTLSLARQRFPSWLISFLHAFLGVVGILLVFAGVMQHSADTWVHVSLWVFVFTAAGGMSMSLQHARRQRPARSVVLAHASMALTAFVILLLTVQLAA